MTAKKKVASIRTSKTVLDVLMRKSKTPHSESILVTPDMAEELIDCKYMPDFQRLLNSDSVKKLSIEMQNGRFEPTSITFGSFVDGDGVWRLVNLDGKTRLNAIIHSGMAQWLHVCVNTYETEGDAKRAYGRIDRGRARNFSDWMRANGVLDDVSLIAIIERKLKPIAISLKLGFTVGRSGARGGATVFDEQEAIVFEYLDSIEAYSDILSECGNNDIKRILSNKSVAAVAIATLQGRRELAEEFWSRVASNSGLVNDAPEKTLVDKLVFLAAEGCGDIANARKARMCAKAWNAYYSSEQLEYHKVKISYKNAISIKGTKFEK